MKSDGMDIGDALISQVLSDSSDSVEEKIVYFMEGIRCVFQNVCP